MEARSQQRSDSSKASSSVDGFAKKQATAAQKPFAVFDIDGTLIRWQLYHAIVDTLAKLGFISVGDYKSITYARQAWKRRSHPEAFKDYEHKLIEFYNESVADLTLEQLDQAIKLAFEEYKDQVYAYTRGLIKDLKAQGYLLFAISASHAEIVALVAAHYDFDDYTGTEFLKKKGRFTGQVVSPYASKDKVLLELVKKHRAGFAGSVAVGDSSSDIKMLKLVERPVAFNPEQSLFEEAKRQGWKVVIERKNMIYELEPTSGRYVLAKTS